MKIKKWIFPLTGLMIIVLIVFSSKKNERYVTSFISMNTLITIQIDSNNTSFSSSLSDSLRSLFDAIDKTCNIFGESQLSNINHLTSTSTTDSFVIIDNHLLLSLLDSAFFYRNSTDHTYNPGIAPLTILWNVNSSNPSLPHKDSIDVALEKVRSSNSCRLSRDTLFYARGSSFDLGGIAKGFALSLADSILDYHLQKGNINSFLIDAGRSISGRRSGSSFKIGISHPRLEGYVYGSFMMPSGYFSCTCGDYERFFIHDGIRYHHVFDPITGNPAHKCVSVTVCGPSSTCCDALSTALFVMGRDRGSEFLNTFDGYGALFIYESQEGLFHYATNTFVNDYKFELINND